MKIVQLKDVIAIVLFFMPFVQYCQALINYSKDNRSAYLHNNEFLNGGKDLNIKKIESYPIKGAYSPSHYGLLGVKSGSGVCNYIYFPTNYVLVPGQQYHINLTIKVTKDYKQLPYFMDHFGFALSSDLFENYFGLWGKQYVPFGHLDIETPITLDFEFRPLCTSKYLLIGVFQGQTMDDKHCFGCKYFFELHSLTIEKSKNPDAKFYYLCDANEEKKLDKWNYSNPDTIYFDSGSALVKDKYFAVLDSLKSKLKTVQDLIYLFGFTDKEGSKNETLGAARNASVRDAIIRRGIDSSRIVMVNYGEKYSSKNITAKDRKVEITTSLGKLYQKHYTEALQAVENQDYGAANIAIKNWLRTVPPDEAIYAIFDCWGSGNKAELFKKDLLKSIRSKFYKNKILQFTFDSLYCETFAGSDIEAILTINRLPTYYEFCNIEYDRGKQKKLQNTANELFLKHGFLARVEIGNVGNIAIPTIILASEDLRYQQKYLPLVKEACENEKLDWKYYAALFDKVHIKTTGFQRYGTQVMQNKKGTLSFSSPIEEIEQLNEYRKQVKLAPYPDELIKEAEKNQKSLDKDLVILLNTILQSDQRYRNQTGEIESKYGSDSDTLKTHWKIIHETDSLNLIRVKELIDKKGWLGPEIIGQSGNSTLFLVIQHSDLETQIKYFPLMQKAVKTGDANSVDLAMLEDRIAIRQRKEQKYGTQVEKDPDSGEYFVSPLIEPEKVNERRAKVGLGTIEKYVKRWNINWDVEKQRKINNIMLKKGKE